MWDFYAPFLSVRHESETLNQVDDHQMSHVK